MPNLKAKGLFSVPGDYIYFKSQVPLHKIPVGVKQWRYYDFGPKGVPPLICIPGTAGSADVYYKQIMALSMKGYRVISVDIPRVWNHHEWIHSFEKFLDVVDVHHIHIYGTSLGGFLAQLFAQHRPRRVKSLVLSNTFLDTRTFSSAMPWAPFVSWTPSFLLKRYVLTGIRDGPHEPFIADSVDFVVSQVEALSKDDLASRLTLTSDSGSVGPLLLPDASITIMDTNDYCATPQQLKDEVSERYPGARRAYLKSGGDFPFLSRPDEVNLHLQLHLRRVGVEPRPDLVRGAPQPTIVGNPYEETWRQSDVHQFEDVGTSREHQINTEILDENDDNPQKTNDQEIEDLLEITKETCKDPLDGNPREDNDDPFGDNNYGFSRGPSRSIDADNSGKPPEAGPENSEDTSKNGESKNSNESTKDSERNHMLSFPNDIKLSCSNDFGVRLLNHDLEKVVADIIMVSDCPLILVSFVLHTYVSALYISCVHSYRCSRVV